MNQQQTPQNAGRVVKSSKIDQITAVQDSIDSFSLSLFEALRGLRDAVAPESSLINNNGDPSTVISDTTSRRTAIDHEDMDYDDFLVAYHEDDPFALELIRSSEGNPPKSREEFLKLKAKNMMKKHAELHSKLAQSVLQESAAVDDLVSKLPGKTKSEQMARIQELMDQNVQAQSDLERAHEQSIQKRNEIRSILQEVTCKALSIQEER